MSPIFTTPYASKASAVRGGKRAGLENVNVVEIDGKWFVQDQSRFANVDPIALETVVTDAITDAGNADEFEMSEEELALQAGRAKPLDELGDLSSQGTGIDMPSVPAGQGEPLTDATVDLMIPKVVTEGFVPAGTELAKVAADRVAATPAPKAPKAPAAPKVPGTKSKKLQVLDMLQGAGATVAEIAAALSISDIAARSLIGDLRNDLVVVTANKVEGSRQVRYTAK